MRVVTKFIAFVLLILAGAIAATAMDRTESSGEMFGTPTPTESILAEEQLEPLEPEVAGTNDQQ